MYLCYVDESGTTGTHPNDTSHFVLAGISIPIAQWTDADQEIFTTLAPYDLIMVRAPSLTNFSMDAERRLCMLLVGLTELRRPLSMAVHESLSQRLVVRHHIGSLDRDELDADLAHRLRLAGCELPLFEPPAIEPLFQASRGLPWQINRIAHYALSAAALAKARTVDVEHMQNALNELRP